MSRLFLKRGNKVVNHAETGHSAFYVLFGLSVVTDADLMLDVLIGNSQQTGKGEHRFENSGCVHNATGAPLGSSPIIQSLQPLVN